MFSEADRFSHYKYFNQSNAALYAENDRFLTNERESLIATIRFNNAHKPKRRMRPMKNLKIRSITMTHSIAFTLALLLTRVASAESDEQPQLFEGNIGSAAIVMELTTEKDNAVTGRYFYRKHHLDIALDGIKRADGSIQLGENQDYGDDKVVDMVLHPTQGNWQGTWQGHDAKKLKNIAITLTPLTSKIHQPSYRLPPESSPYDQIRLNSLSLRKQKITHFGNYDLQWWLEPVSKVSFFRVVSGYPIDTLARINTVLTNRQWQEINSYFSCQFDGARNSGGEYEVAVTPRFMNDKLLSSSVQTSYYCGGAHPDFSDNPVNMDVKTGAALQLEDVFWLEKTKPMALKRGAHGERTEYDYETQVFGPWVSQTMTKLYPNEVGSDNKDDDCDYRDPELWQFPAFYFTPKGLHLAAYFARAARVCDNPDWAIVPWKIVNQHKGILKMKLP